MTTLGIALALACAAMANLGMLCKHRGRASRPRSGSAPRCAARQHSSSRGGGRSASRSPPPPGSCTSPRWRSRPCRSQAVIAGGLVLLAYPATRYFGHTLNRREWLGLGLAAAGLAFLAVTVLHAHESGPSVATMIVLRDGAHRRRLRALCLRGAASRLDLPRRRPRTVIGSVDRRLQRRHQGAHRGHGGGRAILLSPWTIVAVIGGLGAFFALACGCSSARRSRSSQPRRSPRTARPFSAASWSSATRSAPASRTGSRPRVRRRDRRGAAAGAAKRADARLIRRPLATGDR